MRRPKVRTLLLNASRYCFLQYKRLFRREILVLGDSHAAVFKHKLFRSSFPRYFFNLVSVGGATVSGLENPNAKSQALSIFWGRLKNSKANTAIVLLGEVDTGFVIWYRAEKHNVSVSEMFEKALTNYQKLLSDLLKKYRVVCISTPLPTIRDGQDWGAIANARKEVRATQRQRTDLTIQFNKRMHEFCGKNGMAYLSCDDETLGQNGLVDDWLLNADPNDHHYEWEKYAEILIEKLKVNIEAGKVAF